MGGMVVLVTTERKSLALENIVKMCPIELGMQFTVLLPASSGGGSVLPQRSHKPGICKPYINKAESSGVKTQFYLPNGVTEEKIEDYTREEILEEMLKYSIAL